MSDNYLDKYRQQYFQAIFQSNFLDYKKGLLLIQLAQSLLNLKIYQTVKNIITLKHLLKFIITPIDDG